MFYSKLHPSRSYHLPTVGSIHNNRPEEHIKSLPSVEGLGINKVSMRYDLIAPCVRSTSNISVATKITLPEVVVVFTAKSP